MSLPASVEGVGGASPSAAASCHLDTSLPALCTCRMCARPCSGLSNHCTGAQVLVWVLGRGGGRGEGKGGLHWRGAHRYIKQFKQSVTNKENSHKGVYAFRLSSSDLKITYPVILHASLHRKWVFIGSDTGSNQQPCKAHQTQAGLGLTSVPTTDLSSATRLSVGCNPACVMAQYARLLVAA